MNFIRVYRNRFGVEPICNKLSAHWHRDCPEHLHAHQARGFGPTETELDEAYAAHRIYQLWENNRRVYGRRKLWKAALPNGMAIGRDHVERLTKITGIKGGSRGMHRKKTTIANPAHHRHPDRVNRRWTYPTRPDQWWFADFTYVWTSKGFCYVAFVVDASSRIILGWVVSTVMDTRMVLMDLEHTLSARRRKKLDFMSITVMPAHSTFRWCSRTLWPMPGSRARSTVSGDALDNAKMESTNGLYKTELIYLGPQRTWRDAKEVETKSASLIYWHNHQRLHSSIGDAPPIEYEQDNEEFNTTRKTQPDSLQGYPRPARRLKSCSTVCHARIQKLR